MHQPVSGILVIDLIWGELIVECPKQIESRSMTSFCAFWMMETIKLNASYI